MNKKENNVTLNLQLVKYLILKNYSGEEKENSEEKDGENEKEDVSAEDIAMLSKMSSQTFEVIGELLRNFIVEASLRAKRKRKLETTDAVAGQKKKIKAKHVAMILPHLLLDF